MDGNDPLSEEGGDGPRAVRRRYADRGYDWEAIKHEVIHSDWSIDRIARKYGPHVSTVRARAKKEGWVRLIGTVPLMPGPKPPGPGTNKGGRPTAAETRRRNLARRLFKVIDAMLQEIETRMQQAEGNAAPRSAADTERDVRGANNLMSLYAKLVELDKQSGSETEGAAGNEDADQFRRELALRLDRLRREGET